MLCINILVLYNFVKICLNPCACWKNLEILVFIHLEMDNKYKIQ
jgi:hypothetical protein